MKFISYIRVSTQRQGQSGLGLEAQQTAVAQFVTQRGGKVLREFVEVESGRKSDRPQLAAAIAAAKAEGAVLLIAKLDRLARNVAFVAALLESGAEVQAADMPEANRFMLHILAAVAENEAEAISTRTKAALAAAKARGVALGWAQSNRDPETHRAATQKGNAVSAEVRSAKAESFAEQLRPVIREIGGDASLSAIARELNARGIRTQRGKAWSPVQVSRVLERLAA